MQTERHGEFSNENNINSVRIKNVGSTLKESFELGPYMVN